MAAGVLAALQYAPLLLGAAQSAAGLFKKQTPYPTLDYRTPESATKALSNAEYVASQTQLPGYNTIKSNIGENTSNAIGSLMASADSPATVQGNIARIVGGANNSLQELGIAGANNFQQNQGMLRSQLNTNAGYENQGQIMEYQDRLRKFEMERERKQALIGSGIQNLFTGASEISKNDFWEKMIAGLNNNNTTTSTPTSGSSFDWGSFSLKQPNSTSVGSTGSTVPNTDFGKTPANLNPKSGIDIWTFLNK